MKKQLTFCDICGRQQSEDTHRWIDYFGRISLSFKNVPAVQEVHEYEDVCPTCAKAVNEKIKEAIGVIRAPLTEALK